MKRRLAAACCVILLTGFFAACGRSESPAADVRSEQSEDGTAGERSMPAEDAGASAGESDPSSAGDLRLTVIHSTMETEDTYTPPAENGEAEEAFPYGVVTYPSFAVPAETEAAYPALAESLTEWSDERYEASLGKLAEDWNMGAEMAAGEYVYFHSPNYDDCRAGVVRADDRAVSVLLTTDSYANGAHPFVSYESFFVDTQSGEFLPLSDVVADMFVLPEAIWENLESVNGAYDFSGDREELMPKIEESVADGYLVWTMDDAGFHAFFDAYDLMFYAFGDIRADIAYDDYPGLFLERYLPADAGAPLEERIAYAEGDTTRWSYETLTQYGAGQDGYDEGEGMSFLIECPDWEVPYLADGIFDTLTESLITLKEVHKESSEWLDSDVWSARTGIALPDTLYGYGSSFGDERYWYYTDNADGTSLRLEVFDQTEGRDLGVYDFSEYLNTPAAGNPMLEISYAKLTDGTLYVEIAHRTYSESQPYTGFLAAVEADTGRLLWRSEMLLANAHNFVIDGDFLICSYGFTAEDDYLYILSRASGAVLDKKKLKSAPYYFIEDTGNPAKTVFYVLTYNTAYTYDVSYG